MGYCTTADVYSKVPPGTITNPGRAVASVSVSTNTLVVANHGLADDDVVRVVADAGGSVPTGLSASTDYYAIVVNDDSIQVAATVGGAAIDLTTTGSNVLLVRELPFTTWIANATALMDQTALGNVAIDETAIPQVVRDMTAALAAHEALTFVGASTVDLERVIDRTQKLFDRWLRGAAIRGTNAPSGAAVAVAGTAATTSARGYSNGGTIP